MRKHCADRDSYKSELWSGGEQSRLTMHDGRGVYNKDALQSLGLSTAASDNCTRLPTQTATALDCIDAFC